MRTIRTVWLVALAVLAAAACTEAPTEPVPNRESGVVSIEGSTTLDNFLNNPDNGNSRILRVESEPVLALFDDTPGSSLLALHSSFPICGGTLIPVSVQEIHHNPDDPFTGRIMAILQGKDINIWVVDLANPGSCFGRELVAGGTGRLQATDNDVYPPFWGGSNANAYGYMANATLTTPSGAQAHYNAMQRTSWKQDDFGNIVFDHVTEKFNLKIKRD